MEAIPGYLIDRKLSSGGTAGVYRAIDIETDQHIAIKILFPKWSKDPVALDLMAREAWLLKSMSHPNVVKGLASGRWRGLHWHAMEWVAGPTALERVHKGGALSPLAVLELGRQLGEATRYLWKRGILHGDIKPANVLLAPGGTAKMCDFGFAQIMSGPDAQRNVGAFGTAAYASPEQQAGADDLDVRSDLYGIGATLMHMATGRMPPMVDPWGALPDLGNTVSREVKWVLNRLIAPDRNDRYASAEMFLADLDHLRGLRARRSRGPAAVKKAVERAKGEFHWEFN